MKTDMYKDLAVRFNAAKSFLLYCEHNKFNRHAIATAFEEQGIKVNNLFISTFIQLFLRKLENHYYEFTNTLPIYFKFVEYFYEKMHRKQSEYNKKYKMNKQQPKVSSEEEKAIMLLLSLGYTIKK